MNLPSYGWMTYLSNRCSAVGNDVLIGALQQTGNLVADTAVLEGRGIEAVPQVFHRLGDCRTGDGGAAQGGNNAIDDAFVISIGAGGQVI